jgi:hypothetical protein
MYQKITPQNSDEYCNVMDDKTAFQYLNPREETLALIMQFARVCYVETKLPPSLSEIILN